mmetsp:Transcript_9102/g.12915  ORF Transcript_9102/g.12915 Transcript_9102/m.12915 type:complete len:112 (-) Transcript_9102:2249-2584(-)
MFFKSGRSRPGPGYTISIVLDDEVESYPSITPPGEKCDMVTAEFNFHVFSFVDRSFESDVLAGRFGFLFSCVFSSSRPFAGKQRFSCSGISNTRKNLLDCYKNNTWYSSRA